MSASIRRADPQDAATLADLARATFLETFVEDYAICYPMDDLAVFLAASVGTPAFDAILADPTHALWLLECGDRAIGYAVAGPCTLPHPETRTGDGELKRLYLRKSARGRGAGSRLVTIALAWLEREGPRRLWLGVWSGNVGAQRLYARLGFVKAGDYEFPVGSWRDHEFIFRRG